MFKAGRDSQPGLELDCSRDASALHSLSSLTDSKPHPIHPDEAVQFNTYATVRRNPFNLSPLWFGAAIALTTALLVGGAVGIGLGLTKSQSSRCNLQAAGTP
jgi:hypothetical protein